MRNGYVTLALALALTAMLMCVRVVRADGGGSSGGGDYHHCDAEHCKRWDASWGRCVSTCAACETCHHGQCKDSCEHSYCLECDHESGRCKSTCAACEQCDDYGQCADTCNEDYCVKCDTESGQCESTCADPCEKCDGHGSCNARCKEENCEECHGGTCLSKCPPCSHCDGYGRCVEECTESCEECDERTEQCRSTCTGPCEVCDSYRGQCSVDKTLKNACGKCPTQYGFDDCCELAENIGFKGCVALPCTDDLCKTQDKIECRLRTLEQEVFGCEVDTDCADCDTCTTDTCNQRTNKCAHEPIEFDEEKRCGRCDQFAPEYGSYSRSRCDDDNPHTHDSCHEGRCVHRLKRSAPHISPSPTPPS